MDITYGWRGAVEDRELVDLTESYGDHAFLLDPKVHPELQRRGIGTELVRSALRHARAAGCEWLHVDFDPSLERFYIDACGFTPTPAGSIHLPTDALG